ncbi:MAG: YkgJ family cysteine cluster protein [Phycisphaerae bacterium]|nr:YkgJ family cysteine cluster protein [Phycisphaerae bacterium]
MMDPVSAPTPVPIELTIFGGTLRARVPVPAGPTTAGDLLTPLRAITDAVVALSVKSVEREGRSVSCRAGCGACCRQLVPISRVEARRLLGVIEAMPDPRGAAVRERFRRAAEAIRAAGLSDTLLHPRREKIESLRELGVDYFRLGVPCPFLEDESCGIYEERPLICREYLVTSPAERCATLDDVKGVPVPFKPSIALSRLGEEPGREVVAFVPLAQLFEWAAEQPETPPADDPPRPGPEILGEFMERLSQSGATPPVIGAEAAVGWAATRRRGHAPPG